jgi:CBS domain-containing protein
MSVGRICSREIDIAEANETARDAARRMLQRGVGTLVVLNDDRQPAGLVTDRDLVVRVLAPARDPETTRVSDIMTADPKVLREDSPIEGALGLMRAGSFRRVPIVDAAGRLVGILTLDDVLSLLAEEFGHIGGLLEGQ